MGVTMVTYLDRALEAAKSARKMRESGDSNGACDRAYYAVFYAAQSATTKDADDAIEAMDRLLAFAEPLLRGDL
jgi:HEPN domain-containing protein